MLSFGIPRSGAASRSQMARPRAGSSLTQQGVVLLCIAVIAVFAGYVCVFIGDVVIARPAFAVALPLVLAMVFLFVLNPKALAMAVIVLRGGADPVFQNTQLGSVGGLGGMVNLAVIVLLIGMVAREPTRVPRAAWWVWLPFLAVQFIGLGYSPDRYQALRLVLAQVSTCAMFLLAFFLVDDLRSLHKALRLVVLSSLLVVGLTVIGIARGDVYSSLDGIETVSGRYAGPFPHPNVLAFYLVLLIGILFYIWKRSPGPAGSADGLTKIACGLYMLVLFALLYATKTRSAWLGAGFLFVLFGLFVERRYLLYMVGGLALAMTFPEFRDRVYDLSQGNTVGQYGTLNSFAWRKFLWTSGLSWMEPVRYLVGYGNNAFNTYSIDFFPLAAGHKWNAHSVFVQLIFEMGVAGVVSYLWLFVAALRLMWPVVQQDLAMKIVFVATLASYVIASASDNMLSYLVFNWYFWFAIGAVCAAGGLTRPKTAGRQPLRDSRRPVRFAAGVP